MKNPFLNAAVAVLYIMLIVTGLHLTQSVPEGFKSTVIPMAMLSLLVFSVALMGYLFFWGPVMLYIDGDKKGAADLFLKTLGLFGSCMILFFAYLLVMLLK